MDDAILFAERLIIGVIAAVVLFKHHHQIRGAIENFRNNFPPGGQPPTHPSPTCDGVILGRSRRTD